MNIFKLSFLLFSSFFLLQSMGQPSDLEDSKITPVKIKRKKSNNKALNRFLGTASKYYSDTNQNNNNSLMSQNYDLGKMGDNKKLVKNLSTSQIISIAPSVLKREDSPPEIRKKIVAKIVDRSQIVNNESFKEQMLQDKQKIEKNLKKYAERQQLPDLSKKEVKNHIEELKESGRKNNTLRRSNSDPDVTVNLLRKSDSKKSEESSDEEK